jgi:hypothetical protein
VFDGHGSVLGQPPTGLVFYEVINLLTVVGCAEHHCCPQVGWDVSVGSHQHPSGSSHSVPWCCRTLEVSDNSLCISSDASVGSALKTFITLLKMPSVAKLTWKTAYFRPFYTTVSATPCNVQYLELNTIHLTMRRVGNLALCRGRRNFLNCLVLLLAEICTLLKRNPITDHYESENSSGKHK